MSLPNNVYGWNRFESPHGQPRMTANGLPQLFASANLPTLMPDDLDAPEYPYSPVLIEMGTAPVNHTQSPTVPTVAAPGTPMDQPGKPSLWQTIAQGLFGGMLGATTRNSTRSLGSQ